MSITGMLCSQQFFSANSYEIGYWNCIVWEFSKAFLMSSNVPAVGWWVVNCYAGMCAIVWEQQGLFCVCLAYCMEAFGASGWEKDIIYLQINGVVGNLGWLIAHNGYSVASALFARRCALQRHTTLKMTSSMQREGYTHQETHHQGLFQMEEMA